MDLDILQSSLLFLKQRVAMSLYDLQNEKGFYTKKPSNLIAMMNIGKEY